LLGWKILTTTTAEGKTKDASNKARTISKGVEESFHQTTNFGILKRSN
jgi:hypothetical protein